MCHCRFRILVRASLPRLSHLTASALRLQSAPLPRGLFSLAVRREALFPVHCMRFLIHLPCYEQALEKAKTNRIPLGQAVSYFLFVF